MQEYQLLKPGEKKLKLKTLRKIVKKNIVRLFNHLKDQDDLVKATKIIPPGYKNCSTVVMPTLFKEQYTMNGTQLLSIEDLHVMNNTDRNGLKTVNGTPNQVVTVNCSKDKGPKRLASDLGWGSEDDDDDVIVELQHGPRRVFGEQEWCSEPDIFSNYQCAIPFTQTSPNSHDNDVKCNLLYSTEESEDTAPSQFEQNTPNCIAISGNLDKRKEENDDNDKEKGEEKREDALPINTFLKSFRCYHRKRSRPVEKDCDIVDITPSNGDQPFCVISEVVGNADVAFSKNDQEPLLITPKKTNDITKIKGWRRKQFLVEKPTTVEFFINRTGAPKKKMNVIKGKDEQLEVKDAEMIKNAFTCESLDEFLDKEAGLKINYDIPHLYAEVGIKLTREDIVSKPNLSEEEVIEVGTRYCKDVPHIKQEPTFDESSIRVNEKLQEEEVVDYYKILKFDKNKRRIIQIEQKIEQNKSPFPRPVTYPKQRIPKSTPSGDRTVVEEDPKSNANYRTSLQDFLLTSKLIGAVVYPGPSKPVHPLVRAHLDKLRSYRTNIDRNWADFAVSALRTGQLPPAQLKRKILPVFCPGKTERPFVPKCELECDENVDLQVDVIIDVETLSSPEEFASEETVPDIQETSVVTTEEPPSPKISRRNPLHGFNNRIKQCSVVIDKLSLNKCVKIWCMEHSQYDCDLCGFVPSRPESDACYSEPSDDEVEEIPLLDTSEVRDVETDSSNEENVIVQVDPPVPEEATSEKESSPLVQELSLMGEQDLPQSQQKSDRAIRTYRRTLFNKRLTNLLARKLRDIAFCDELLINVDKLKVLAPNGLELIKLNYVKQSFLADYINLWYLKGNRGLKVRSRAFLTFSDELPEPKAIRIRRTENNLLSMPKVIMELVSPEKVFDNGEYAILYCTGNAWEIQGSLNIAVDKNVDVADAPATPVVENQENVEVEQIFIPIPLAEMENIRKVATRILNVKATKWWVLDMSQKFGEMVLQISTQNTVISRRHLLNVIKSGFLGFLAMRKRKGRLYGSYILNTLLPFVLIGPFYTFESCSVSVRQAYTCAPQKFVYNEIEGSAMSCTLKFFINSVIIAQEGSGKKLDGLWLYDEESVESACYLETLTTEMVYSLPRTDYTIETEHGYGMNSLTSTYNFSRPMKRERPIALGIPVYLYFSVFELGYVTGELQDDNSILMGHPLAPDTKIKSHNIGNLFIGLLKRRIQFIPNGFTPQWFISRHKQDVAGRKPFNKFYLGGAHILCQKGLLSLLKMTEKKINYLGLTKEEILSAIGRSPVIQEVTALKELNDVLTKESSANTPMHEVLEKAVKVIRELEVDYGQLIRMRLQAEKRKLGLWEKYVSLLSESKRNDQEKIRLLFTVIQRGRYRKSEVNDCVEEILNKFEFGKTFLAKLESNGLTQRNKNDEKEEETKAGQEERTTEQKENGEQPKNSHTTEEKTSTKTERNLRPRVAANPPGRKSQVVDRVLVKRLESKLFRVRESLDKNGTSSTAPEYKRLIKKVNALSEQIDAIKEICREERKRAGVPEPSSVRGRKKGAEKSRRGRKPKRRGRPPVEKEPGKENKTRLTDSRTDSTSVATNESKQTSGATIGTNGKVLQSSRRTNGNRGSDQKMVVMQKRWSIQRLNIAQTLKMFKKEMAERKRNRKE